MISQISLPLVHKGKVGDVYSADEKHLLLVRSDRASGFNVKLLTEIPGKGKVLNQMSQWWMNGPLKGVVPNHLSDIPVSDFLPPEEVEALSGRGVIVKKLTPILIEAVVRRHLVGTGYDAYHATGKVCGIPLSPGLKSGDRLAEGIFTPTLKSHDDPHITFVQMCDQIGSIQAFAIRERSLEIFRIAEYYLADRGIILADMKLEFGLDENGTLTLMDEVLTPDSSRFWLKRPYEASRKIVSLDKQKLRDWLKSQKDDGSWNGDTPITIPPELVTELSLDYEKIHQRVTVNPVVGVVMGSESDWSTMKLAVGILKKFGIPYEAEVVSAHRTPKLLTDYAHNARRRGLKLIIAGAGGAAHLPGMLAAETTLPILGVPIKSSILSGVDSLYSIVQMPKGVPVATFAIGDAGAVNAALYAVAILAGNDAELQKKLDEFRERQVKTVLAMELPDE